MTDLVIIAYNSNEKAENARKKLFKLQKEWLIELGDAWWQCASPMAA